MSQKIITPINGYYTVGNEIYYNKFEALLASTKNKHQVHWHWHQEYDQINWQIDSPISVKEIYRLRAQQLRDKYKYLVLSFSGGADSWTVLNSFISNNIHLDEVYVRWPFSAVEKLYNPNTVDKNPSNILSEWDYAIKPQLEMLQKNYPNIQITLHDISNDILATEYNDNTLIQSHESIGAGWWVKYGSLSNHEQKRMQDPGSVGFILALDKPQIRVKDNQVYCYFLDTLVNGSVPPNHRERSIELFYWSKDMPEVTYVQAREIYNYMKSSPGIAKLVQFGGVFDNNSKYIWDMCMKGIIYTDYKIDTFQAKKTTNLVYNTVDAWLSNLMDTHSFQAWESMVKNLSISLDQQYVKYENNKMSGVAGYISKMYYLGDLPT